VSWGGWESLLHEGGPASEIPRLEALFKGGQGSTSGCCFIEKEEEEEEEEEMPH
jgi:hypothetical protein